MKLFASPTSPYARKVRIVLLEKGLPFELVEDSPWEVNTRIPSLNPLGKVPVLVLDNGETIYDSPVIVGYLETLGAAPALLPVDPLERVRVRQLEALADGVLDAAVAALLESRRPPENRSEAAIARDKLKISRALDALEQGTRNRNWLHGDRMSLADIAVATALAYLDLRHPDIAWRDSCPGLKALDEKMSPRASFKATVPPLG